MTSQAESEAAVLRYLGEMYGKTNSDGSITFEPDELIKGVTDLTANALFAAVRTEAIETIKLIDALTGEFQERDIRKKRPKTHEKVRQEFAIAVIELLAKANSINLDFRKS